MIIPQRRALPPSGRCCLFLEDFFFTLRWGFFYEKIMYTIQNIFQLSRLNYCLLVHKVSLPAYLWWTSDRAEHITEKVLFLNIVVHHQNPPCFIVVFNYDVLVSPLMVPNLFPIYCFRHKLARFMILNPPFDKAKNHR